MTDPRTSLTGIGSGLDWPIVSHQADQVDAHTQLHAAEYGVDLRSDAEARAAAFGALVVLAQLFHGPRSTTLGELTPDLVAYARGLAQATSTMEAHS